MGGYNEEPDLGNHLISLEQRIAAVEVRGTHSSRYGVVSRAFDTTYTPDNLFPTLVTVSINIVDDADAFLSVDGENAGVVGSATTGLSLSFNLAAIVPARSTYEITYLSGGIGFALIRMVTEFRIP